MYIFEGTLDTDLLSPYLQWQVEVISSHSAHFFCISSVSIVALTGSFPGASQGFWTAELH